MVSFRRIWDWFYELILYIIHLLWPVKSYGTTGARNPYAVYRAIYGDDPFTKNSEKNDSESKSSSVLAIPPKDARERLNNLGSGGSGLSYEKLFDPYYGSCLFSKITIEEVKGFQHEKIFLKRERSSGITAVDDSGLGKNSSGNIPQFIQLDGAPKFSGCVDDFRNWDPDNPALPDDPVTLCVDWLDPDTLEDDKKTVINYPDTVHPSFDDSVQGPVPDCYFLAALSTIAWFDFNYPNRATGILAKDKKNPIIFADIKMKLYSVSGKSILPPLKAIAVNTNYLLPRNKNGDFQGVKTRTGNASWLPYYEKAFLRYLETTGILTPGDPNKPDICRIQGGDPGETLRALLRRPNGKLNRYIMNSRLPNHNSNDPEAVWLRLNSVVAEKASENPANQARRTQYPAVARTFGCSGPDITGDPEPSLYAATAKGVIYDDELIVASHSYSLLGIMMDSNNQRYIILRNPYGENPGYEYGMQYDANGNPKYHLFGDVGRQPVGPTGEKAIDYRLTFPSIVYNGTPYSIAPWIPVNTTAGTVVMPNKGKFAIRLDDFVNYFQEFDYVLI
ncbi:hypothetical protein [Methanoregula sp.]|uniref:hypothetical protein n=1 Tax=Methanoregula sp. TaxID=2052170 RepID=UPI00260A7A4E|nr:hypothetical protein [Methanoregula sp.]MDD5141970.1 hypothetical protein [Methanoregula sp.]